MSQVKWVKCPLTLKRSSWFHSPTFGLHLGHLSQRQSTNGGVEGLKQGVACCIASSHLESHRLTPVPGRVYDVPRLVLAEVVKRHRVSRHGHPGICEPFPTSTRHQRPSSTNRFADSRPHLSRQLPQHFGEYGDPWARQRPATPAIVRTVDGGRPRSQAGGAL